MLTNCFLKELISYDNLTLIIGVILNILYNVNLTNMAIIIFLLILSILVLIHEFGHFYVAKRLGVKVEEFGFGLPPRAWGKKIGETIYSINWLPIGGFVKLFGEDEAGAGRIQKTIKKVIDEINILDRNRAFFTKSVWQRAAIVVAGVAMNFFLAVVIYYTFLFISGFKTDLPLLGNHKFFLVNQQNVSDIVISTVSKDSPAEKGGIKPTSKVESVNGEKIDNINEFTNIINKNKGKEITISLTDLQNGKTFQAKVVPRVSPPKGQGALGISFYPVITAVLNYQTPVQKIFSGFVHPINLLAYNFDIIGKLITISIQEKTAAPLGETVSGPVGIYSVVGSIVQIPSLKERILQLLNLAGLLSISLALFNILPIPALDGGRLFFILFEGVTGRKVPAKYESYAHAVGMAVLLTLIAIITFQDLTRLFSGKLPFSP